MLGRRAGQVGALGQIRRRRFGLLETELVGHAVLVEDVGQALDFAGGGREERDAIARFHQGARLGDRHLHVAVEGHGRARGDVDAGLGAVGDQPISSCWKATCGAAAAWRSSSSQRKKMRSGS